MSKPEIINRRPHYTETMKTPAQTARIALGYERNGQEVLLRNVFRAGWDAARASGADRWDEENAFFRALYSEGSR